MADPMLVAMALTSSIVALDCFDSFFGCALDLGDAGTDFLGGARGLCCQTLNLGRHDRKATTRLACARRFDGGVQRQQVGLAGNAGYQLDHMFDLLGAFRQRANGCVSAACAINCVAGDLGRLRNLAADLGDR